MTSALVQRSLVLAAFVSAALGLTPQFLAHLAKGNVSFCHHLESIVRPLSYVICRPLIFHILIFSSETPQPNEVKMRIFRKCQPDCRIFAG
jgi:hypothetical protein